MNLSDAILLANEVPEPFDWYRLGEHLPLEWIEAALAEKGKASIRHRRLPAQQVVWLVIALALYRHRSIGDVLAELDLALPNVTAPFVTDGAARVTKVLARTRDSDGRCERKQAILAHVTDGPFHVQGH